MIRSSDNEDILPLSLLKPRNINSLKSTLKSAILESNNIYVVPAATENLSKFSNTVEEIKKQFDQWWKYTYVLLVLE